MGVCTPHLYGENVSLEFAPFIAYYEQKWGGPILLWVPTNIKGGGGWEPILPRVPMDSKGVLGTYSTRSPHGQQGSAGDLFYVIRNNKIGGENVTEQTMMSRACHERFGAFLGVDLY